MENFITFLVVVGIICLVAFAGGGILWLIWPIVIPSIFPGLVENGTLAGKIDLWPAICTVWFFALLIKSSNTSNNKKK